MSITLATGTQLAIASAYGASKTMSAISNASQAVATLEASHGVNVGDFLEITSGWDHLDKRIVRVAAVDTNDVTLEDINTSDTSKFPAGTGTGSVREITAWTTIQQVRTLTPSGGDPNFEDVTTLADRTQKQIPTTRSATALAITVLDDPSLAYFPVVQAAAEDLVPAGLRIVYPNGTRSVTNGYWSVGEPQPESQRALTRQINFTAAAEPVRYPD